ERSCEQDYSETRRSRHVRSTARRHGSRNPCVRGDEPLPLPGMTRDGDFNRFRGTPGYIATGPLVDAVNCAIALGRPLLLKGAPGTGRTVLARHVADGLGMPIIEWHIKSTSKAVDGLYVYDTVQRLNDSRFGTGDVADIRRYIKLGPLGRAFAAADR